MQRISIKHCQCFGFDRTRQSWAPLRSRTLWTSWGSSWLPWGPRECSDWDGNVFLPLFSIENEKYSDNKLSFREFLSLSDILIELVAKRSLNLFPCLCYVVNLTLSCPQTYWYWMYTVFHNSCPIQKEIKHSAVHWPISDFNVANWSYAQYNFFVRRNSLYTVACN